MLGEASRDLVLLRRPAVAVGADVETRDDGALWDPLVKVPWTERGLGRIGVFGLPASEFRGLAEGFFEMFGRREDGLAITCNGPEGLPGGEVDCTA
jgi:hypothetical protein